MVRKGPLAYERAHNPAFGQLDTWSVPTSLLTRTAIVRGRHTRAPTSPDFPRGVDASPWSCGLTGGERNLEPTLQVAGVWSILGCRGLLHPISQPLPLPCGFDPPFLCRRCVKHRRPRSHWIGGVVRVLLVCASEAFVWTPWLRHGKLTQRATLGLAQRLGAFWCGKPVTLLICH